ncbi:NAD(P)-binding protein [Aspergillus steynii IBT 23096]|uniref:NAD(P)-binding protein n=1 Tax=Aspergillus steynii IBT 23096 TaxID=1392250 RepID=A0A2I2G5S2_9EURO|nr:NAD(P)-binding protein [Aspergillus steynii IBT 23096]PLB48232.1 NAD(P)-binding protein [Aspergillus steynii IBT 23096]
MPSSVFLIGPGFIGGEILRHLLEENYSVTVLVRRQSNVAEYERLGIRTIIGTLDDPDVISKQVAASDIVFHTATADHLPSVRAVIDGLRQRERQGLLTLYIHTSGTSLLSDGAAGDWKSDTVFDDESPAQIDALPDSAPHRQIDLAIVNARKELANFTKMAIMIPPLIYGVSSANRTSIQLPTITRYSLKHGYAGQVGKGLSVWSQVHVKDLARGYMTLLHWMENAPVVELIENPYFFCENGHELSWGECSAEIGRILHKAGRINEAKPKAIPQENYGDIFGHYTATVVGSNSRSRAIRLRKLGWTPTEKQTLASLAEDEIGLIMQESGEFTGYSKAVAS